MEPVTGIAVAVDDHVTFEMPEFIPFLIQGDACFDGPAPVAGDVVDLVCYGVEPATKMDPRPSYKFRWRVRR